MRFFKRLPSALWSAREVIAGGVLAMALVLAAGRVLWWRVDAAAAGVAVGGNADAAASLAHDWVTAVAPTALSGQGEIGERARVVATVRLNYVAEHLDDAASRRAAIALLSRLAAPGEPPTPEGAQWATWAVRRLVEEAGRSPAADRLKLFTRADQALLSLRRRPVRLAAKSPPTPAPFEQEEIESEPDPSSTPATAESVAVVSPVEPIAEPTDGPTTDPTDAPTNEPVVIVTPPPARDEPIVAGPMAPSPTPQLAEPAELPWRAGAPPAAARDIDTAQPLLAELNERELLAEFLQASREAPVPPSPTDASASGPVGLRRGAARTNKASKGPVEEPVDDPTDDPTDEATLRLIAARDELTRRGYTDVTPSQAEAILSPDAERRITLAEELLVSPSTDAAKLLLLLAEDRVANVRRSAISALGSSSSAQLVEIALRLATNDPDPAVGRLAETFRARLRR